MKRRMPTRSAIGPADERAERARAEEDAEQGPDQARIAVQHVDVVERHEGREAELRPRAKRDDQDQQAIAPAMVGRLTRWRGPRRAAADGGARAAAAPR